MPFKTNCLKSFCHFVCFIWALRMSLKRLLLNMNFFILLLPNLECYWIVTSYFIAKYFSHQIKCDCLPFMEMGFHTLHTEQIKPQILLIRLDPPCDKTGRTQGMEDLWSSVWHSLYFLCFFFWQVVRFWDSGVSYMMKVHGNFVSRLPFFMYMKCLFTLC